MPDPLPDPLRDPLPDPLPDPLRDPVPDPLPDPVPDPLRDPVPDPPVAHPSRRTTLAALAGATVVIGLAVSRAPDPVGNVGGTILYAVLVYLLVGAVRPTARPARLAAVALAICWAIELAQLTPWPARLADAAPPSAYVLGTTFAWGDLVGYAVGVGAVLLADVARTRRRDAS